jgi:dihydroorotase
MPTLLRNAHVIDPASNLDGVLDVALADGRIVEIGKRLTTLPAWEVLECEGQLLLPGLVDPHVHLREPGQEHKETIATGTRAAAAGGFTSVCCMPNTSPALDTPETLAWVASRAASTAVCRVFAVAAATKGRKGEELAELSLLRRAGAVAFSDDGDCIATPGMMSRVLSGVKATGACFMQHCQEPTLTRGSAMHAGTIATKLGLGGWPRVAEELIIERDVRLNMAIGCAYHAQHLSSGGSVQLIARAREAGLPVTAEVCPHHLTLTHDACDNYNTIAKVNPPLREQSDIDALLKGVASGVITILATDHAPHSADEKSLAFEDAPFGMLGLQTALPIFYEVLVEAGVISLPAMVAMMTSNPAKLCGLDAFGLGTLRVGGPADCTLFDPSARWRVEPASMLSKSKNTPFSGMMMHGAVRATFVAGQRVV